MKLTKRIYRLRPLTAVLLCLFGLLPSLWYTWQGLAAFSRYRRASSENRSLSLTQLQLQIHDLLQRDLRRLMMLGSPKRSQVKRFSFQIKADQMDSLLKGAKTESKRPYVTATLEKGNKFQVLKLRLRGQQHWHLLGKKKSLKVKLPKGVLIDGQRVFNFINDPTPMLVGEQIILDLASEHNVLTPNSSFARVELNGMNLGLFRYTSQPDEGVLRMNQRIPGSIFSGNLPKSAPTESLWTDSSTWKKVAWRNEKEKEDRSELENLLNQIKHASVAQFADFARRSIDLKAFATFEALDIIFGGDQHDFRENHKLYFDPYKGRWEPVAWNFRGYKHEPVFNLAENPLLLRLKMVPEYLALCSRILYQLLVTSVSPSAVREKVTQTIMELAPELVIDPYWQAYKLLPSVDSFHRRMMRPMNFRKLALVVESEMTTFGIRHAFLVNELQKNPLKALLLTGSSDVLSVRLSVDGQAGVRLTGFSAKWPSTCTRPNWQVFDSEAALMTASQDSHADLDQAIDLFPRVALVAQEKLDPKYGLVRSQMIPAEYTFFLRSTCQPDELVAEGIHLATWSRVRSLKAQAFSDRLPKQALLAHQVPRLVAGEVAPQPQSLSLPPRETVVLGPGKVAFLDSKSFSAHQSVRLVAGTQVVLAAGASLTFLGPVSFEGSRQKPITIQSEGDEPWGGIAIQGPATAGSSLKHVEAVGGSVLSSTTIPYPGMINIHNTEQISIEHCHFGSNRDSDDVLHLAYVTKLSIDDLRIDDARSDALDLEFSKGVSRGLLIRAAGDDGVDSMGSTIDLMDSSLVGCSGNAISAGEESQVFIQDTLLAESGVAVLAKNASEVKLTGSLLYHNKVGIQVYRRTRRFDGDSQIKGDVLYVVGSQKGIKRSDRTDDTLDQGRIQRRLPPAGILAHLLHDVLELDRWSSLPKWLDQQIRAGAP